MTDEQWSMRLNGHLYGRPDETFCSRLWRYRWLPWCAVVAAWIDCEAVRLHGEGWGHCRRAWEAQRDRDCAAAMGRLDLPGRLRRAGM